MAKPELAACIDLRPVLAERIHRLQIQLQALQAGLNNHPADCHPTSDDTVHDFRVAAYESLACKSLFRVAGPTNAWRHRIRKAHRSLSNLRDLQQMQEKLPADSALLPLLHKRAQKAQHRWLTDCPTWMDNVLTQALARSAKKLPQTEAADLLMAWQTQWQHNCHKLQCRLSQANAADLHSLHRLRIRYKKWRYLLEVLAESGASLSLPPHSLKVWQDKLGAVEDHRVMAALATQFHCATEAAQFQAQAEKLAQTFMAEELPVFALFLKKQQNSVKACLHMQRSIQSTAP